MKYRNNIYDCILLFGATEDFEQTGKYKITRENKIISNIDRNDDIDLKSGLYVYYDTTNEDEKKITFFIYDENKVGEIKNKIVYNVQDYKNITSKDDVLKAIINNIDDIFQENSNNNENGEKHNSSEQESDDKRVINDKKIIQEKFFQLFIPCMKEDYRIDNEYFKNNKSRQQSFVNGQLKDVKERINKFCSCDLQKNTIDNVLKKQQTNKLKNNKSTNPIQAKQTNFLAWCRNAIEQCYLRQYVRFNKEKCANNNLVDKNLQAEESMKNNYCCL